VESLPYEGGSYRTRPGRPSPLAKAFPSAVGHWRILSLVLRASRMSKRGKYGDEEWAHSCISVLRALESVGVEFEITGIGNIRSFDGPCVIVANHMSTLETFCLPGIILPHKRLTFVVKESLIRYPVFRHIMRATEPIAVTRRSPRDDLKAVLAGGEERLGRGMSLIVFPQTTRTADLDPSEFNTLGVKLARRAGVPLVPLALKTDAWGIGPLFLKDFGKIDPSKTVHMCFGEPLNVAGRGEEEHRKVVEFIASKLKEWRGRL